MQDVLSQRLALEPAGEQVRGSKLFRQFCRVCNEPIRVVERDRLKPCLCVDCRPRLYSHNNIATPRRVRMDTDTMNTTDLGRLLGIDRSLE